MKLKQLFIIASVVTMPAYAQQKWDLKQCIDHAIANKLTIKLQEAVFGCAQLYFTLLALGFL